VKTVFFFCDALLKPFWRFWGFFLFLFCAASQGFFGAFFSPLAWGFFCFYGVKNKR